MNMHSPTHRTISAYFKGLDLSRVQIVEREVVRIILKSKIHDEKRAWSKTFELKHSSSVTQFGRLLAQKRGLDPEISAIICCLHDVYVFATGRVMDHAHKGAIIAEKILKKIKKFSSNEIKLIKIAIYNHSDKHKISSNPYVELVKDADVFDCGLYAGFHDAYVDEKSQAHCKKYFARIKAVRKELGLPKDGQWDVLEYVERGKNIN